MRNTAHQQRQLLTVIDCLSRYAMAIPIKSKEPSNIVQGLSAAFKKYGIPLKIEDLAGNISLDISMSMSCQKLLLINVKSSELRRLLSRGNCTVGHNTL